jgi:hypothetical protein
MVSVVRKEGILLKFLPTPDRLARGEQLPSVLRRGTFPDGKASAANSRNPASESRSARIMRKLPIGLLVWLGAGGHSTLSRPFGSAKPNVQYSAVQNGFSVSTPRP